MKFLLRLVLVAVALYGLTGGQPPKNAEAQTLTKQANVQEVQPVQPATPEKVATVQSNGQTEQETSQPQQPPAAPKDIAKATLEDLGQGDAWYAVEYIGFKESSWNPTAVNEIGACGLFQALPCSKLGCDLSDVACQVRWATNYATQRYGNWHNAYTFWRSHNWW